MFGFQRVGDAAWQAGDMRARGFLLGATAGRTTLNGEGLQHEDGHSMVQAGLIPNVLSYDPTFSYEVVTLVQHRSEAHTSELQSLMLISYAVFCLNKKRDTTASNHDNK